MRAFTSVPSALQVEVTDRAEAEIATYFGGLDPLPLGLVDVWAGQPDSEWFWPLRPPPRPGIPRDHAAAGPGRRAGPGPARSGR